MKQVASKRQRCAIYTRKSTEHNLDLTFTSLDAQREACEAYIKSQAHEGWTLVRDRFDDGGLSGASLGPTVCTCFDVGRNEILEAAATPGCGSVAAIGERLKAGTNCGSCRSEIGKLIEPIARRRLLAP